MACIPDLHWAPAALQVESFAEPQRNLRLDIQLSIPKWGKACGWTARDDAMLMLGVHWHGLAHWENIAADDRSACQPASHLSAVPIFCYNEEISMSDVRSHEFSHYELATL